MQACLAHAQAGQGVGNKASRSAPRQAPTRTWGWMSLPSMPADVHAMLNEERRRTIIDMIAADGCVVVRNLADHLSTFCVTIRGDLDILESQGMIQRVRGGALRYRAFPSPRLRESERGYRAGERRIARGSGKAGPAWPVRRPDVWFDGNRDINGSARFHRLTVITNAVNIAADLAGSTIETILTAGSLRENSFSLCGPLA